MMRIPMAFMCLYDLQTALEYFVILVKQKMLDRSTEQSFSFHKRLQEALITSAAEQGGNMPT